MSRHSFLKSLRQAAGYPRALAVSLAAWFLFGLLQLVIGFGAVAPAEDSAEVDRVRDQLGSPAVSGTPPLFENLTALVVGLGVLALALVLLTGRGWARYPIAVLGMVGVIALALSARTEALVGIVLLAVGIAPLMLPSVHRFLSAHTEGSGTGKVWNSAQ